MCMLLGSPFLQDCLAALMGSLAEAVAAAERVDVGEKTELLSLCGLEGTHMA